MASKDVKVFDGATWQSIVGPPGPSQPSADFGNIIEVGSDGLLYACEPTRVRFEEVDSPPLDNSPINYIDCHGETAHAYENAYPVVWGQSVIPASAPYIETSSFVLGSRRYADLFNNFEAQLDLLGSSTALRMSVLNDLNGKLSSGAIISCRGGSAAPSLALEIPSPSTYRDFDKTGTVYPVVEFFPTSVDIDGTINIRATANPADKRNATVFVSSDGSLVIGNRSDANAIQASLTLDRLGNITVSGATVGALNAGQSSAVEAAEDFVVGYRGMLCHGVANYDGRLAILNVTNQAGQFNLASKDFNTGTVTCSYRIQAQATGTFRIFDVTANANRISWATNGDMTVPGNTAFQGATNTFRQASINSEALGPMQFVPLDNNARQLAASDIGKVILFSGTGAVNINLTTNAAIPVGSVVEILNTATGTASISSDASTFLFYNVRNTYFGGASADVEFSGRFTTVRLIKTASNTWIAIGDLANPNK
jgi:hypothetical protein